MPESPLIIGHRGACGHLPEHTLQSYQRALELGADALETDVVLTGDGQLVCRHDCELSTTTDVADHPEFAPRKTTRLIEGVEAQGWFVHDFTLDEIRTLKARERFDFRNHSADNQFGIASLDDLLDLAARQRTTRGNRPGVVIEIKHATYFDSIGLPMLDAVERALRKHSLTTADAPVWVECFEIAILQRLRRRVATPLIQLLDAPHMRPADVAAAGGLTTYAQMLTPDGLQQIATYASAIGAWKRLIVPALLDAGPESAGLRIGPPTTLVSDAHAAGLAVHAWTFRSEPRFLATDYGGDPAREYEQFAALGVDGFITDFPDSCRREQRREDGRGE